MIAEEYEAQIIEEIESSPIKDHTMKDDLVDHFCCLVEMHMEKGKSFEAAMNLARDQTAPNGLEEIQKETIFLLNYTKIMFMKRFTYVTGYLFSLIWVAGIGFKILSIAGAGVLLGVGGLGLAFIFLPLLMINRYKHLAREVLSEKMKWILGGISLLFLILSISMKFLHLMGAGLMLGASFFIFGFGFLPFLFFRMYKKSVAEL